jgi:putative transposase
MSTPKHRTAPGTSYFITTKCWQSRAVFQVSENAEILTETLFHYRHCGAYFLHEFVVMLDHLHLLLTPSTTTSFEKAIQLIKGGSSYRIHRVRNQRMEIWQIGFYDWTIRDRNDWQAKVEYIHDNPVRAKLVEKAKDWPYSSASGKFSLDPIPEKFLQLSSGAKAQSTSAQTLGLKPQPPKADCKQASPSAKVARA